MNKHEIWLWAWYVVGSLMFWLKRAYFMVSPPNPVALNYRHFIERAWAPLLVRFFADSLVFWALFTPGFADSALAYFGWARASEALSMVTKYAVFSAAFGFMVDSILDVALSKTPIIKDTLPQMPGPLSANVNPTDENLMEAKKNVDAAADKLHDVVAPK
jgi:hypothetical protein